MNPTELLITTSGIYSILDDFDKFNIDQQNDIKKYIVDVLCKEPIMRFYIGTMAIFNPKLKHIILPKP